MFWKNIYWFNPVNIKIPHPRKKEKKYKKHSHQTSPVGCADEHRSTELWMIWVHITNCPLYTDWIELNRIELNWIGMQPVTVSCLLLAVSHFSFSLYLLVICLYQKNVVVFFFHFHLSRNEYNLTLKYSIWAGTVWCPVWQYLPAVYN